MPLGRRVGAVAEATVEQIVHLMVGRELTEMLHKQPIERGEPVLAVRGLARSDSGLADVNLTVHAGEIVALAGLAGMIQASRVASGQPAAGWGDKLRVIAAVIIGGASFRGGEGTVLGAVLGAAIMGVLRQGLVLLEVKTFWQKFVEGAVIIGAVALDMIRRWRGKH